MLLSVKLRNFKAFRDEQSIPLAPLTLIFGKNSSGKSSILQSLLFLRQSMGSLASGRPPVFSGDDVDLMSMRHTMHGQGNDKSVDGLGIGVSFAWSSDTSFWARFSRRLGPTLPDTHLGFQFDWPWNYKDGQVGEGSWAVTVSGEDEPTFTGSIRHLTHRVGFPLPSVEPSSSYMQLMFEVYGRKMWSVFDTNLEAWTNLFREPGMLRDALTDVTQDDALNILQSVGVLRWINPALLGEHERNVTGELIESIESIELITRWFKKYFRTTDFSSQSSTEYVYRYDIRSMEHDSESDYNPSADPEIEQSLNVVLGPRDSQRPQSSENMKSPQGDVNKTIDCTSDIIKILHNLQTVFHSTPDMEVFIQEYVFVHSQSLNTISRVIAYASDNLVSGLLDDRAVSSPLRVGPRRWVSAARDGLAAALGAISHVGPVREQLARLYVRDQVRSGSADESGLPAFRFGTARTDKRRRDGGTGELRERLREQELCDQVNGALSRLGVAYALSVEPQEIKAFKGAEADAVVLTDTVNNVRVGMQDVGYGVGQIIPLIAEVMTLGSRTLLIEQPELHLHPGLQAELGAVLVDAVKRFPRGQIIAETHSEHVILRIQKLIRQQIIPPELVSIVYIDRDKTYGGRKTRIPMDEKGEFTVRWPQGFFRERLKETID